MAGQRVRFHDGVVLDYPGGLPDEQTVMQDYLRQKSTPASSSPETLPTSSRLGRLGLSPLLNLASIPQRLAGSLLDKQSVLGRSPEATLGAVGMAAGSELLPGFGSALGGALGAGVGKSIELGREPPQTSGLSTSPGKEIAKSALFGGGLPLVGESLLALGRGAPKLARAVQLERQLAKLPSDEAEFIRGMRKAMEAIPGKAQGRFTEEFLNPLLDKTPEKVGDFTESVKRIRGMLNENESFKKLLQAELKLASPQERAVALRLFPGELGVGEAETGAVRLSESSRGTQLSSEEYQDLLTKAHALRPEQVEIALDPEKAQLTFQESQQLKNLFRRPMLRAMGEEPVDIPEASSNSRIAYHSVRADQVGQFDKYKEAAAAYHQSLSDYRALQKASSNFSVSGVPGQLKTLFGITDTLLGRRQLGGTPEVFESAERQLAPATMERIRDYARAAHLSGFQARLAGRAATASVLLPFVYGPLWGLRRTLGSALTAPPQSLLGTRRR